MKDYIGFGALNEALEALGRESHRKVLVVASGSGWERFCAAGDRPFFAGREVCLFKDFAPNPEFKEILAGAERLRNFQPDIIIAIGGGSPMDVAKMMKAVVFTKEEYDAAKPESLKPSGEGPPLAAVATTSGSGSEATQFAVFYKDSVKQSLAHPSLRPDMAVVDPEMTYSLPPGQTAATGFDALSQAVESYWAGAATSESRELSRTAIGYIIPNLYNAVHAPAPGNRYNMAQAAYLAGKAINTTRTTMPHALCYHLTKRYGLPHGHATAITLPYFFLLNTDPSLPVNSPLTLERNRENMNDLFAMLGQQSAEDAYVFWRNLMRACGLASTLSEVGVDDADKMRALVSSMNMVRMKNHPVAIDSEYLVEYFLAHP